MIKPGSIVFSKKVRERGEKFAVEYVSEKEREIISVVIGTLNLKGKLPTKSQCIQLMGEIGYFPGDLIVKVFGQKGWEKFVRAFKKEYGK